MTCSVACILLNEYVVLQPWQYQKVLICTGIESAEAGIAEADDGMSMLL